MNITAQIIGFISSVILLGSTQIKNDKKKLLMFYIIGYSLHVISFIILKAYTGAISCFISAVETVIMYKIKPSKPVIVFFIIITLLGGIISFTDIYSIFPVLTGFIFIITITEKNMSKVRKLTLLSRTLWAIYEIIVHSYSVMIFDLIAIFSTIIAIIRFDILNKNKDSKEVKLLCASTEEVVELQ